MIGQVLLIHFAPDGTIGFYPVGDPEVLAERLQHLAAHFVENPSQARCAAGDHAACRDR
jgi:hypothetical protein